VGAPNTKNNFLYHVRNLLLVERVYDLHSLSHRDTLLGLDVPYTPQAITARL